MVLHINSCHDDYSAGWCYGNGTGVAQNLQEAVRYFDLAADQGDADARYNLGESCALRDIYLFIY
jgi:TPR repeat protein